MYHFHSQYSLIPITAQLNETRKYVIFIVLGSLVFIVLATGPKVCGLKPGPGPRIFKGDKNPQHDFFRMGSKAVGPTS
jgi:hypothetical protein